MKTTIIETLQRQVDGTIDEVEQKYKDSEIILEADDLTNVEFSENGYTMLENNILNEIHNFCQNECGSCTDCPEESCVLYRIERLIVNE